MSKTDYLQAIGRVRRAQPLNKDVMLICDQYEKLLLAHSPVAPLPEGYTRKGGQNPLPKDFKRPAPPPAFVNDLRSYWKDQKRKYRAKKGSSRGKD